MCYSDLANVIRPRAARHTDRTCVKADCPTNTVLHIYYYIILCVLIMTTVTNVLKYYVYIRV